MLFVSSFPSFYENMVFFCIKAWTGIASYLHTNIYFALGTFPMKCKVKAVKKKNSFHCPCQFIHPASLSLTAKFIVWPDIPLNSQRWGRKQMCRRKSVYKEAVLQLSPACQPSLKISPPSFILALIYPRGASLNRKEAGGTKQLEKEA